MVFVIAIESRDHETDGRASKCSLNEQDRTTILGSRKDVKRKYKGKLTLIALTYKNVLEGDL